MAEEEKLVRYCVEQRASPYKKFEHRSSFMTGSSSHRKRKLFFRDGSKEELKIAPESSNRTACEEAGDGQPPPGWNHVDITAVADAVGKLQVQEVREEGNIPAPLTNQDVTAAASRVKAKSTLFARCQGGPKGRSTIKKVQKPYMAAPPIKDCLVKESSLLKEIKADEAQRLASAFNKAQQQILGKRAEANRDGEAGGGKCVQQEEDTATSQSKHGTQEEPTEVDKEEATSPGAAGLSEAMMLLCWNFRGIGQPRTVQDLVPLVQVNKPNIVFSF